MSSRLSRLAESHARIDRALQQELGLARPQIAQLVRLKKLKLRIKDLISRLQRHPAEG